VVYEVVSQPAPPITADRSPIRSVRIASFESRYRRGLTDSSCVILREAFFMMAAHFRMTMPPVPLSGCWSVVYDVVSQPEPPAARASSLASSVLTVSLDSCSLRCFRSGFATWARVFFFMKGSLVK
jgi:hypothetical protein